MTDEVLAVVQEAIGVVCARPPASIRLDTTLADLDVDSLALVELAELVEIRLRPCLPDLCISDADLERFRAVADVVDYLACRL